MPQHPGDGHFAWPAAMARAHLAKPLDQFEVLRKTGLLEFLIAAAKVIGGQLGGAFAGHRAGEQAGSHWSVRNHADTLLLAIGESLFFHLAPKQRIRRLKRGDRRNSLGALNLRRVKVRHAYPADLPRFLEFRHRVPSFFERRAIVGRRPVHLKEVDGFELQPAETLLAFAADGDCRVIRLYLAILVPRQRTLGENVGATTAPFL